MNATMNPPTLQCIPPVRLDNGDRDSLLHYFQNTWNLYEMLFSSIQEEGALYKNPDPLRHPLIFYLGHTAVFYINKLVIAGLLSEDERINPHFERLFEQGVDPSKAEELGTEAWPVESEVRAYRREAYDLITDFISNSVDFDEEIAPEHPLWSVFMGLEHDRIHYETSSVLIRQYPESWVERPEGWQYAPTDLKAPANYWISVPATQVELGKPADFPTFGWDNEYGAKSVPVFGFQASRNLITNAEFMEFVLSGGYVTKEYWSEKGWTWRCKSNVSKPRFWVEAEGKYAYRAMFDELPMPESWPVEVNAYEASAYCKWKGDGARLLTEGEFRAIATTAVYQPIDLPWCDHYNLAMKWGSPCPVGMMSEAGSTLGFNDVWGNVWCWLSNDFQPLPGYKVHPYYEDFSEPYMDTDHATLLGGSWASSGTSASKYYRLWFRRHFYQHAGFRIARDL